jgi:carboxypeptidase family protein
MSRSVMRLIALAASAAAACSRGGGESSAAQTVSGQRAIGGQVVDLRTGAPVAGARVILEHSAGAEPEVTYTNARGVYALHAPEGSTSRGGRVVITAPDYGDVSQAVPLGAGTQVDVKLQRRDRAAMAAPPSGSPKTVRSDSVLSGVGRNWSGWYRLCSDQVGDNEEIVEPIEFRLEGDRTCGSWAECREAVRQPRQVCWEFRMQGHEDQPYPGQQSSRGVLQYSVARSANPAAARRVKGVVFIQYIGDVELPKTLAAALTAEGYSVAPLQLVQQSFRDNVRYFHDDDARQASEVAALATKLLAGRHAPLDPALLHGFETRVPLGQFEVWIHASQ